LCLHLKARHSQPSATSNATSYITEAGACNLAAALVGIDLLSAQRDSTLASLCTGRRRLRLHPGLNLRGHGEKGLFNVGRRLRRSLQKLNTERVRKLLALLCADHTLGRQIGLVTHQQLVDVFSCVPINLMQPLLDIVEGFSISHVVNNDNAVGATVVRRGNGPEAFLSGRVPNLELDGFCVKLNGTNFLCNIK
jgi:hypothetical protein